MANLEWDGGSFDVTVSDLKQAVFSFWFKVPSESIAEANAEYLTWLDGDSPRPRLLGIIPLLVFGREKTGAGVTTHEVDLGDAAVVTHYIWDSTICDWKLKPLSPPVFTANPSTTPSAPVTQFTASGSNFDIDPSYIGVDCTTVPPTFSVHLLMGDASSQIDGVFQCHTSSDPSGAVASNQWLGGAPTSSPPCAGSPAGVDGDGQTLPIDSISSTIFNTGFGDVVLGNRPESFRTRPRDVEGQDSRDLRDTGGQRVSAGKWHHAIVSFDLTSSCATVGNIQTADGPDPTLGTQSDRTSSTCSMFISFDDHDLTGKKLSCYWPTGSGDPHAILPVNGYYVASTNIFNPPVAPFNSHDGNLITITNNYEDPAYSYSPSGAPVEGLIGIPATTERVDAIKTIEMAELQVFVDTTVDTSDLGIRRLFVTDVGKPEEMTVAAAALGRPVIALKGSVNWIAGVSTGSLGDLVASGTITEYSPGPGL
jgi:hypothetical protein